MITIALDPVHNIFYDDLERWLQNNVGQEEVDYWLHFKLVDYSAARQRLTHITVADPKKALIAQLRWQ